MDQIAAVLNRAAAALSVVPGILGIVLGGSRARGNHSDASDIDIGIYYDGETLDLAALDLAAEQVDDGHRKGLIASPGDWGPWVNSGAWLMVGGRPVDFILRDMERVKQVIHDCRNGVVSANYQTGHPHAFVNAVYMGELAVCKVLWDKEGVLREQKRAAEIYPEALKQAMIGLFGFEMEFSLMLAERYSHGDDPYYVTGHLVRSVSALNQVLFALNEEYCLNEKKAVALINSFAVCPDHYQERIDRIFAEAGITAAVSCRILKELIGEVKGMI